MVKVDIITIGDEILIGQIVDTNSAWLGSRLNLLGFSVNEVISVGDNEKDITDAINSSLRRSDIVIMTGGLGPTKDDITKKVLSHIFNSPLIRDERSFEKIKKHIERRGIAFNELNQQQALVPEAAKIIDNDNGTAPGMLFEKDGKVLVSLPGVPFEMKAICEKYLFDELTERFKPKVNVHITAITFGVPESMLAQKIEKWEDALPENIKLAYLPNPNHVRLRLSAYDVPDKAECEKKIYGLFDELKAILKDNFIGFEGDSVESRLASQLLERNATLCTAESCTGGNIAHKITLRSGSSRYFKGGIVSYDNSIKSGVLGVKKETLEKHGAVSKEVVEEMAERAVELFGTDYSIAVSGIAGPTGGTEEKPVGTVWIAVRTPKSTYSVLKYFGNLREQNIEYATNHALNLLSEKINGEH